ncbi:hypothetical protein VCUG_02743 [Vavraia culicis subsp. floridensis]|uniref:Uncharacterized protein n=1 Tax=Vavraia culicis (isolate floridensis) TaxID=948595 RepID=L2GRN9_VAVCU|nr:uncharacterized protein VCUG_02743 [Vavraia culicis subsp. floridensis]ELA45770.1 hypothetical protein VCUG_02743 [Vavraia culicis subsp. floridensis]
MDSGEKITSIKKEVEEFKRKCALEKAQAKISATLKKQVQVTMPNYERRHCVVVQKNPVPVSFGETKAKETKKQIVSPSICNKKICKKQKKAKKILKLTKT